jgi:hypothetical protein
MSDFRCRLKRFGHRADYLLLQGELFFGCASGAEPGNAARFLLLVSLGAVPVDGLRVEETSVSSKQLTHLPAGTTMC